MNDEEAPRASHVWILATLWSALFLGSLDGTLFHRLVTAGHSYIPVTTRTIVAPLLSQVHPSIDRINRLTLGLRVYCLYPVSRHYPGDYREFLDVKGRCFWYFRYSVRGRYCMASRRRRTFLLLCAIAGTGGGGSVLQFYTFRRRRSQCPHFRSQSHDLSVEVWMKCKRINAPSLVLSVTVTDLILLFVPPSRSNL